MGKHYLVNDSLFYADNPYVAKNPYLTMEAEDTPLPTYAEAKDKLPRPDFVGWTGLIPIAVLIEYVFGIQADAKNDEIVWRVNLCEEHGIEKYPFGGKFVDLHCEAREKPPRSL